jgi:hypothetical protein
MSTSSTNRIKIYSLLSKLFLLVPLALWGLWIYISQRDINSTLYENQAKFDSLLPGFMRSNMNFFLIIVLFCVISMVLAAICLKVKSESSKAINIIVISIAGLMILMQLFSML